MTHPKALFFDVGGTIFDWKTSALEACQNTLSGDVSVEDLDGFTMAWRKAFFLQRERVAHGYSPWVNADQMHLVALRGLVETYPFLKDIKDQEGFVRDVWHNLKPFPGAAEALARLREKYPVIVLTVLSWASIVKSSKQHNLVWDGVLSCEFLGAYKPSFEAYRRACQLLAVESEESMMVAAHEQDLAAAKMTGMKTAYVNVNSSDKIFEVPMVTKEAFQHDIRVESFSQLCEALNC